jgi:hypothetical protein
VIIGAHLLEKEYAPTRIDQIVICEVGDPVLETVGGRMKRYLGGCNGARRLRMRFRKGAVVRVNVVFWEEFRWPRWSCSIPYWGSGQG